MKILFLPVAIGGGHMKTAEAVKEYIDNNFENAQTMMVDTLKYINPMVDLVVVGGYLNTIKSTPMVYRKLYEMAENTDNLSDFSKTVNQMLSFKIKKLVQTFGPDVIVCTHPFPLQMITTLKRRGKVEAKIMAILTDFAPHSFWHYKEVDTYIVAHQSVKCEMISRGVNPEIIHPLGIPISSRFSIDYNKAEIRSRLGLKDIPTILLMGGSLGFGDIKDIFLALLNCSLNIQTIAVTGKNKRLKTKMEKYAKDSAKPVKILGFTDEIPELMSASDFIITKPGGITISEALAKKLPIIIISPIPGQEEKNAHFLQNNGVAIRIYEKENVELILKQLFENSLRIRQMVQMAEHLSKPHAAEDISKLIRRMCEE